MNYHIINCNNITHVLANGYIGVGMAFDDSSTRKLLNSCKINYSMFADMKTVAPGDMVFIHAGEYIYGAFAAASVFREDPNATNCFRCANIHYKVNPNIQGSGWRNLVSANLAVPAGDIRQLSVSHFQDAHGNNLCYPNGILANEVFDLRRKGRIWSIPERWKYPDSARTIRPIMPSEAEELLKLLERENSDSDNKVTLTSKNMGGMADIDLILNPAVAEDEKIVEAWICEQLHNGKLDHIFGNLSCFGNNVQMGYLQGIDILGLQKSARTEKYKIIELKITPLILTNNYDVFRQVMGYMDWVMGFIVENDPRRVEGFIVAKSFDNQCAEFTENHNKVNYGRQIHLVQYLYLPPTHNCICMGLIL